MLKAFEYRLRPNLYQEQALMQTLIGSRQAYNDALAEWKTHFEKTGTYLSLYTQDRGYNKQTYPNLPAVVVDQTLKRLHRALDRFFKFRKRGDKCGFPRFKSAQRWHSFEFRGAGNALHGRYFHAGKICGGKIRTIVHRPTEGTFQYARIVKRPSGWYVQCVCAVEPQPLKATNKAIGLDMGIKSLVADSRGDTVAHPQCLKNELRALAHSQRILSRKKKGSHRCRKQARIVARRHERIANRRSDFLHKLSLKYVQKYGIIVVEDLNIRGMVQNHHLARAIFDASWGMFLHMLAYKAENAGRRLITVPACFTSQKCSKCGEYVEKSLSVRTHVCPFCGYRADRDVNAARNILRKGLDEAFADCSTRAG